MARGIKIEQGDLTIELRFAKQEFLLLAHNANRYVQAVFPHAERYGATPHDVSFGNAMNVGGRYVNVFMQRLNAGIKLSSGQIDIGFNDIMRPTFADIRGLVIGAASALKEVEGGAKVAAYVVTLNVHGTLDGISAADFIAGYIRARPQGLGPNTGGALGFYHGAEGARTHLAIILDGSALVHGGLYSRVNMAYDASKASAEEVLAIGKQELGRAFSALGLAQSGLDL